MPKTAYELEREANIARNRALLEQLELKSAADAVVGPAKAKATKTKAPQKPRAKTTKPVNREKKVVEATPRRASARLRKSTGVDPNETPAQKRKREQEEEAQRQKEEEERLVVEECAREAKKPRHNDLDLATLAEQEEWEPGALPGLNSALQVLLRERHPRRVADQDAFLFDDHKGEEAEASRLREKLSGLKVIAQAKVTGDRVYSAAYHPEPTKDLMFFGDKHGQLGIWDARAPPDEVEDEDDGESAQKGQGKYWRLQVHWPATSQSSLSCVKFDPIDAHSVYTSAYDSTVRSLSFTSGISHEVFSMDKVLITSIDLPPASHEMWISDAEGWLTHRDLREDKSKRRAYQIAQQKVGCVSVNPVNPTYLVTASNNRVLKVWDTRKIRALPANSKDHRGVLELDLEGFETFLQTKKGSGTLRGEWVHGKSVTSAYWDPRGRSIVSTSYDDSMKVWDVDPSHMTGDAPFSSFKPHTRIRHNCQTGKWVTMLKAQWSQNPDVYPHFTVGNMDHSIDIIGCKGERLAKLSGEIVTATPAVTCTHPSIIDRVAGGVANGRCILWGPEYLAE